MPSSTSVMRRLALFALGMALLAPSQLSADQQANDPSRSMLGWALSGRGSGGFDDVRAVTTDAAGNVYVTGQISKQVAFADGVTVQGDGADMYVAKFRPSGKLAWLRYGMNSKMHAKGMQGQAIAHDAATGDIYVAGRVLRELKVFIAKYNEAGGVVWVKTADGRGDVSGVSVGVGGNVHVTGWFDCRMIFAARNSKVEMKCPSKPATSANYEGFVATFSPAGRLLWLSYLTSFKNDEVRTVGVGADDAGYVYVAGQFGRHFYQDRAHAQVTIAPGTLQEITLQTVGKGRNLFFAKYSPEGKLIFARRDGDLPADDLADFSVSGIAVGNDGHTYVAGRFRAGARAPVVFGADGRHHAKLHHTPPEVDGFLASYDANGNFLWVQQLAGPAVWPLGVSLAGKTLAVTGSLVLNLFGAADPQGTFGHGEEFAASVHNKQSFVAKYDAEEGTVRWAEGMGELNEPAIQARAVAAHKSGRVYVAGSFGMASTRLGERVSLGSAQRQRQLISTGKSDLFLASFADNVAPVVEELTVVVDSSGLKRAVAVTAYVDDRGRGNSDIIKAEYSVDGGQWSPMSISRSSLLGPDVEVVSILGPFSKSEKAQICVRGTDAAGNMSEPACTTLKVDGQAPLVVDVDASPNPIGVGDPVLLTALVTDAERGGSLIKQAELSLDGGASWLAMAATDGEYDTEEETVEAELGPFYSPAVVTVCVRAKDAADNTSEPTCTLVAVAQEGGLASGGGFLQVDSVDTQSSFAFNFHREQKARAGRLHFKFLNGSSRFESTVLEWFAMTSEPRAQFRGAGVLNGMHACKFRADVWDESYGANLNDAFALRIYGCTGGSQEALNVPPTELSVGSIEIRRGM